MILLDNKWAKRALWLYRQKVTGFSVPDYPHFDGDLNTTSFFLERLAQSRMYLEYGSGGSTVTAARNKKNFITVDCDRPYLTSVQKKIEQQFGSVSGVFVHVNIGLTKEWSYPIFTHPTARRLNRWKVYPEAPWRIIEKKMQFPDLVLIDGRFRVACALISLKNLYKKSEFILLIDDYAGRPHYRVVEDFAYLDSMQGRMAVFKPKPIDPTKISAAIDAAISDYTALFADGRLPRRILVLCHEISSLRSHGYIHNQIRTLPINGEGMSAVEKNVIVDRPIVLFDQFCETPVVGIEQLIG